MSGCGVPAARAAGPRAALLLGTVALLFGCADQEFQPPDREAQVAEAARRYSSVPFDTITWASDDARAFAGNGVFSAECRRCHGPLGRGDTEYARERGLDVPSLVRPDWEHADSLDHVRRRIFTGHPAGMPTWGVAGISPREVDAVAFYVLERLRPDVIEGGQELPGDSGAGGEGG